MAAKPVILDVAFSGGKTVDFSATARAPGGKVKTTKEVAVKSQQLRPNTKALRTSDTLAPRKGADFDSISTDPSRPF